MKKVFFSLVVLIFFSGCVGLFDELDSPKSGSTGVSGGSSPGGTGSPFTSSCSTSEECAVLAMQSENYNYCNQVTGDGRDYCINVVATALRDSKGCDTIVSKDIYKVCLQSLAIAMKDKSFCDKLEENEERLFCIEVYNETFVYGDTKAECDAISDNWTRTKCYASVARETGDYTICFEVNPREASVREPGISGVIDYLWNCCDLLKDVGLKEICWDESPV